MTNKAAAPLPPLMSDLAACEKEIENHLARLTAQRAVEPEGYIPFGLDGGQASAAFTKWLNGLVLVPGDLKTTARLNDLQAKYVPFWVASAMTYTTYKGERGENYKDTEGYTDANGQHRTREVTKVRWVPAGGEVRHHFEDLTLCACSGLPQAQVALLQPKDLRRLAGYSPGAIDGAVVEKYTIDPRGGFAKARALMEAEVKKLAEKDVGGAQQKVTKLETRHVNVNLKLVLVPAYSGSYRYKGKDYPLHVNGATGEVQGEYPVSAGKVALVVLIFLLIFAAIVAAAYFFLIRPNLQRSEAPTPAACEVRTASLPLTPPVSRSRIRENSGRGFSRILTNSAPGREFGQNTTTSS
jgi:hypothetical protein